MLFQIIVSGLVIGSIYGLIALGYSLIYKSSGLMSFVQGDMLTFGAFLGYTFYGVMGIPFILSFAMVILLMFALGFAIEKGVIHRLVAKNVLPIYTVLATIAISYIIQNGSMVLFGSDIKYFPPVTSIKGIRVLSLNVQTEAALCIAASVVFMILFNFFMNRTPLGTAMRAATMDPMAARACGIDVGLTTGLSWAIASGIAGFAGMLIGPVYGVYTTLGSVIGTKGFSSAVVGGYGNMLGAIVGGVLLGLTETFLSAYVSSAHKDIIAYFILLLFLFVKPTGIFNERAIAD
ncbi:MAG: branched-chain amino acid ABC transporter permease [Lachnospiraceae bacterium]|jgi:branched-chain amino acid transport system permease protein|nr:branched-chain amino acid ABC transporter permease [Lachnospiraceae bacterium]